MTKKNKEIRAIWLKNQVPELGTKNAMKGRLVPSKDRLLTLEQGGVSVMSEKLPNTEMFIPSSNIAAIEFETESANDK